MKYFKHCLTLKIHQYKKLGEINENLTSLYLAEKSRVLTNMVMRRRCYLEGES
jgi:hypothetical protein